MSFPSPLEADIAHGSLAPDAEPHREVVRKDLTVNGSVLAVYGLEGAGVGGGRCKGQSLLRGAVRETRRHLRLRSRGGTWCLVRGSCNADPKGFSVMDA